jgi:hypothetical protein
VASLGQPDAVPHDPDEVDRNDRPVDGMHQEKYCWKP